MHASVLDFVAKKEEMVIECLLALFTATPKEVGRREGEATR